MHNKSVLNYYERKENMKLGWITYKNFQIVLINVPLFDLEQQLRIRTKIHTKKNKKGFCSLSVTAACQPKNIKELILSQYTLDNKDKLPGNLIYTHL